MLERLASLPALLGAITGLVMLIIIHLVRKYVNRRIQQSYLDGVVDGHKLEVKWYVERALEADRLRRERTLHDSGRRTEARPGAVPAVIHKARIAPPPRKRPDKPL